MAPADFGQLLPEIVTAPPGPASRALAQELARHESPNVTYLGEDFPVFWAEARGANVRDVDGNVYVDLTAAFAVASAGHGHPEIVTAVQAQAARLLHGMGDVHPPDVKVLLLRALAEVTPGGLCRSVLANSGAEAIEVALKTSALATGRPRVIAFHGGYHGLTYGALDVSGGEDFRTPFSAQLARNAIFAPYPYSYRSPFRGDDEAVAAACLRYLEHLLDSPATAAEEVGAILVEPVQGRGGDIVPHPSFLPGLREICDRRQLLLIADEIYTGFGRTGRWFACEHTGVTPDILVAGKALTGGLPLAVCIGTDEVMRAWPPSGGEAIHTSTFLGNPLGCAAALASLQVLREQRLVERAAVVGAHLKTRLEQITSGHPHVGEVRGLGMMVGVELVRNRDSRVPAPELVGHGVVEALRRGLLLLGGGIHGNVLSFSPPFVITDAQLAHALEVLEEVFAGLSVQGSTAEAERGVERN
jgi:4-aminobutyrate aminotransferase / (S)-3-amino-2-methylpropionate transaminase / 5-aminovalerate transaminase